MYVSVDKHTTVREVQRMAEALFFPNGAFKSLKLENHVCFMCDFSQNEVEQDTTVDFKHLLYIHLYPCSLPGPSSW